MKNSKLLYLGYITPLIFWVTTIICGIILDDYNHTKNMVSELGKLHSKTQYIFTIGLVLSSILSIFFILGLYKVSKKTDLKKIPILIILAFSLSMLGSGLFPLPLDLHGILGLPSIFLFLSPLLAMIYWKKNIVKDIYIFSAISLILMIIGFTILLLNIFLDYTGLSQRLFHMGWTVWFIYLSYRFINLNKNEKLQPTPYKINC